MSGERGVCLRFVSRRMESTRCDADFLSARVSPTRMEIVFAPKTLRGKIIRRSGFVARVDHSC